MIQKDLGADDSILQKSEYNALFDVPNESSLYLMVPGTQGDEGP
jgi:hypothetical protein